MSKASEAPTARGDLASAINAYVGSSPARFHVPGHAGNPSTPGLRSPSGAAGPGIAGVLAAARTYDVTELPGLDDLAAPDGPIARLEARLAGLYGAGQSFLSVGGSTLGLQAAVMACAGDGQVVIVPRDCHRAVVAGLVLSGAKPYYIQPGTDPRTGLTLGPSPEGYQRAIADCARAGHAVVAAVVTHPNYYGVVPDTAGICDACHSHGVTVIADEAHGPHLRFTRGAPPDALACGADVVVQSPHKTLVSLTQSAWVHVAPEPAAAASLTQAPQLAATLKARMLLLQTSSPSFLLLASLEQAVAWLEGAAARHLEAALSGADRLRQAASGAGFTVAFGGRRLDPLRVFVCGESSGDALAEALRGHGVHVELSNPAGCLFVVTPGATPGTIDRAARALTGLGPAVVSPPASASARGPKPVPPDAAPPTSPPASHLTSPAACTLGRAGFAPLTPRAASLAPWEELPLALAVGRVSAVTIAPSPPSVALILPGDVVSPSAVRILEDLATHGQKVHGASEASEGGMSRIRVVRARG